MIELVPIGGLCNRMRAIDSALALHHCKGDHLRVFWQVRDELNCSFGELFQPIQGMELVDELPLTSRFLLRFGHFHSLAKVIGSLNGTSYYHHDEFQRLEHDVVSGRLMALKRMHITSFSRFFPTDKNYRLFRPIPMLEDRISGIASQFDPWTIGVHIRRTDNIKAIEGSPTFEFVAAMERSVSADPRTRFYLATDCTAIKKEMSERFADRVITDRTPAVRSSKEGMQQALVELYALSRTSFMLRSHFSSFSRTAAEIGIIGSQVIGQPSSVS
jgi:hypothetical protein